MEFYFYMGRVVYKQLKATLVKERKLVVLQVEDKVAEVVIMSINKGGAQNILEIVSRIEIWEAANKSQALRGTIMLEDCNSELPRYRKSTIINGLYCLARCYRSLRVYRDQNCSATKASG